MTRYLLPCSCGNSVAIGAGQAGQTLTCSCGASLEVPTVRGLTRLQTVADTPGDAPATWSTRQAVMMLGLVVAGAGLAVALYLHFTRPILFDAGQLGRQMDELSPAESLQWWTYFEQQGIDRPLSEAEQVVVTRDRERTRWIWTAAGAAALGLLCVAGAFLTRFTGPPARPLEPTQAHEGSPPRSPA